MRLRDVVGGAGALAAVLGFWSIAQASGAKDYGYKPAVSPKSTVMFSGSDWSRDASYFYSGVIFALNRDLGQDGFVLRGFAGVPMYEYDSDDLGVVDGDGIQGDLMIGYISHRAHLTLSAYIGVDYQDYDLTPHDPTSKVSGDEVGLKVAGDIASAYGSPLYWSLHGAYSTAFDTYWTRARLGYDAGRLVIGPEVIAMGSKGFDAHRIGGFATLRFELSPAIHSEISGHVGHQFVDGGSGESSRGGEGTYGGVGFTLVF